MTSPTALQALIVAAIVLLAQIAFSNAFVATKPQQHPSGRQHQHYTTELLASADVDQTTPLTHADILWKIRPPPEATKRQRLKWKVTANLLRWECILRRRPVPTVLCPNNFPSIVLEAHLKRPKQKIGRNGITCQRGPSAPPIAETVEQLYGISASLAQTIGIAAVIYMVVEPEFRGRNVGSLALEVIALIHAKVNADFTILVCDDKSSREVRTLVKWYEGNGYKRAPLLQNMMGSPNEQFGVSMIAPTDGRGVPDGCTIQWW